MKIEVLLFLNKVLFAISTLIKEKSGKTLRFSYFLLIGKE